MFYLKLRIGLKTVLNADAQWGKITNCVQKLKNYSNKFNFKLKLYLDSHVRWI